MVGGGLCRALNTHAWDIFGAIVILRDNNRRVTLLCRRCETTRQDVWAMNGRMLTRYYKHGSEYSAFIKDYDRQEARGYLLTQLKAVEAPKEKEHGKGNNPDVRLARKHLASRLDVRALEQPGKTPKA